MKIARSNRLGGATRPKFHRQEPVAHARKVTSVDDVASTQAALFVLAPTLDALVV